MLGHRLARTLEERSDRFETWISVRDRLAACADELQCFAGRTAEGVDARRLDSVVAAFELSRPDAVVNCTGVVKQILGSGSEIDSITINALFPHQLAALCQSTGARLITISTDCVFSGAKGNYLESDRCDAEDLYGRTKILGEVTSSRALTLRTSMIGRQLENSHGLLEWFLSNRGGRIHGYRNAIFSGLTTGALSQVIARLIDEHPEMQGIWHVAAEPICKLDLLCRLKDALGLDIDIEAADGPSIDRSLDAGRFKQATGIEIPEWETMIEDLAVELANSREKI